MKPSATPIPALLNTPLCMALLYSLLVSLCMPFSAGAERVTSRRGPAPTSPHRRGVRPKGESNASPRASKKQTAAYRSGELIIGFRADVSEQDKKAIVKGAGASRLRVLRGDSRAEKIGIPAGQSVEATVAGLIANPAVEYAEPNYLINKNDILSGGPKFPHEPRIPRPWSLSGSGTENGKFKNNLSAAPSRAPFVDTTESTVAVIDSGIDFTHPDLAGNEWTNPAPDASGDLHGWDFVADSNVIKDKQGHGTNLAGIITAQGDALAAVSRFKWKAHLMSLRVLDGYGTGDVASAVEAINYAVAHGAQVILCAWGMDEQSFALRFALARTAERGILVVCAAGNGGRDVEVSPYYPASYDLPNIIPVAATDNQDQLWAGSNWGTQHVAAGAPGVDIITTKAGGGAQSVSGTSAAAAMVAGVAGLIRGARPRLAAERTRQMILQGTRVVAALQGKVQSGGIVDAAGALAALDTLTSNEGTNTNSNTNSGGNQNGNNSNANANANNNSNGNSNITNSNTVPGGGAQSGPKPPAVVNGKPGGSLPELTSLRQSQQVTPRAPDPVPSNRKSRKWRFEQPSVRGHRGGNGNANTPVDPQARSTSDKEGTGLLAAVLNTGLAALPALLSNYGWQGVAAFVVSDSPFTIFSSGLRARLTPEVPGRLTLSTIDPPAEPFDPAMPQTPGVVIDPPVWDPDPTHMSTTDTQINLSWLTPTGGTVHHYLVERRANISEPFTVRANQVGTTFSDMGLTRGHAYLYRVRAVDAAGHILNPGPQLLCTAYIFADDPLISSSDQLQNPSLVPTKVKAVHLTELLEAINAARAVALLPGASWIDPAPSTTVYIQARYIEELRSNLNAALTAIGRGPAPSYEDQPLATGVNGTPVRKRHIEQLRERVKRFQAVYPTSPASNCGSEYLQSSDLFIKNFFQAALGRQPQAAELTRWTAQLAQAADLSGTLERGVVESMGRALFKSVEYTSRNRSDSDYLFDLYGAFLQRAPDQGGFDFWMEKLTVNHASRSDLREQFPAVPEFVIVMGQVCARTGGGTGTEDINFAQASVDPFNSTGSEDPFSRNFNWSTPLVGLKGRAGLDLGVSLSYNSLVWTRSGHAMAFDLDGGSPSPGFHLGFPTISSSYYNSQVQAYCYVLVLPSGERVELRQVGTTNVYESADSSRLQLVVNGSLTLYTADGTQMSFSYLDDMYQCTRVEDRNGNYITLAYNGQEQFSTITDTLGRVVTFNYDANQHLQSITQPWTKTDAPATTPTTKTHKWVTFAWKDLTIQTNFSEQNVDHALQGPVDGEVIPVLSSVGLDDGSYYKFQYNTWGQVIKVTHYAADSVDVNHVPQDTDPLSYTSYNLPADAVAAQSDCPRFTERRDWIENGILGADGEALTTYSAPAASSEPTPEGEAHPNALMSVVTMPDGTKSKIYADASGWSKGLVYMTETYEGTTKRRVATTTWEQEGTSSVFPKNPRVKETNISDLQGNRKRTTVDYDAVSKLPTDVKEYAADATAVLRKTHTDYVPDTVYSSRHILGQPSQVIVYDGGTAVFSKVGYVYDEGGDSMIATSPAPSQHDETNYSSTFVQGRGLVTTVKRYDATAPTVESKVTTSKMGYDQCGSVLWTKDALNHQTTIDYTDSFAEGVTGRNTFAYPTKVTDADGFFSMVTYNFDLGAVVSTQGPPPAGNTQGASTKTEYDDAGRVQKITNLVNQAYTRYEYSLNGLDTKTYSTITETLGEAFSAVTSDGAGRPRISVADFPGSAAGHSRGSYRDYDVMGRMVKESNATEVSATFVPAGDDQTTNNSFAVTTQTFDWKGRPLVTTNPDGTSKTASYEGCGCAGGEVVTVQGESVPIPGTSDSGRRTQKVYADVLGRQIKTEVLNWNGAVYSSTTTKYNALDQVVRVRQYIGAAPSTEPDGEGSTYQTTTMEYDGYGRISTKQVPEQQASGGHTTYEYKANDTVWKVTDARGAVTSFTYNNRRMVTAVSSVLAGSSTANISFIYDAVGNRTQMNDMQGWTVYEYDQLSRLKSENRHFNSVSHPSSADQNYKLSYTYSLSGQLASLTDPFNSTVTYSHDLIGRLSGVGGTYGGVTSYVSNVHYRAWGAVKSASFGNGSEETINYDSVLRAKEFRLTSGSTNLLREDYTYFPDGRLSHIQDLDDTQNTNNLETLRVMSRSFTYDQAGRVSSGYGTTPFSQSYQYDSFSNLTSRSGNYNWQTSQTDTASYANNRRTGWTYDADGRLAISPANASSSARTWTYDGTGQLTSTAETVGATVTTYNSASDGDGRIVYETVSGSITNSDYLVRSSVLGGAVITKLDGSGAKSITYVQAGGLVQPMQTTALDSNGQLYLQWVQRNPQGLTEVGGSGYLGLSAYDPLGNNIPLAQHAAAPQPADFMPGQPYGSGAAQFNNVNNYGTGCTLDGAPASCSSVMRAAKNGGASIDSISTTGSLASIANAGLSIATSLKWINGTSGAKPTHEDSGDEVVRVYTDAEKYGHWEETLTFVYDANSGGNFGAVPQKTVSTSTPCDKKVAATFGSDGAVGRTTYDFNGIYRGHDPAAEARLKGSSRIEMGNPLYDAEHLYWFPHLSGNQAGTENTDVYVPGNYQGQPTGPTRAAGVVTFYYRQLFGRKNVTLAVFHVGDFGLKRVGDRVRIGRTGGPGGDSGGPSPNGHAHFELWNGKTGFLAPGAKRDAARIPLTPVICPPGQ